MRGYGGTRFVWNLAMSTLSAPPKRSDAVSDADRVDAAHVAERAVVQRRRTTQATDGPRSLVTEREQSQARRRWRTVDLGSRDLFEGVSECILQESMIQRAPCRYFPFQQHATHTKKREREEKRLLFGPAFPEFFRLVGGRAVVREQLN